ncbi:unnamed protein product [Moneuplotes crassus]|uniref:Uncharacterized protein n=1 Tax=Euplotes crassus TaxID=5936 RepID=A0AAD1XS22_EUPCR|nr:unnamed protein product [Moneuplotes crassus]
MLPQNCHSALVKRVHIQLLAILKTCLPEHLMALISRVIQKKSEMKSNSNLKRRIINLE